MESNEQWVLLHKSANARKYSLGTLKHFNIECADSIFLYENLNVLPRAFLVDKYKVIKEEDALVKELTKSDFVPLQYVLLEEKPLPLYEKENQEKWHELYFNTDGYYGDFCSGRRDVDYWLE